MTALRRGAWTTRLAGTVELDVRNNSLNLIRLVLAGLVLFAHGFELGGHGSGPLIKGDSLGTWSVFGFFAISGYLITASRFANPLGSYLVKRVVRIYPAFVVCNLVTAFVIAPVAWVAKGGNLGALMTANHSPGNYVFANLMLRMQFYDIGGGPNHVPYPRPAWNGSLWSLYYEFLCYLVIGALACIPALRRPAAVAAAFVLSVVVWANIDAVASFVGNNGQFTLLARLLPAFLGGAVYQTVHRRMPLHGVLAAVAALASGAAIVWIDRWGAQAAAPLIAYFVMWVSTVLPSPTLIQRHDISYGVYIYAFPMQQLLAVAGAHRAGLIVYDVLAAVATLACAALSWKVIEAPALRRSSGVPKLAKSRRRAGPALRARSARAGLQRALPWAKDGAG